MIKNGNMMGQTQRWGYFYFWISSDLSLSIACLQEMAVIGQMEAPYGERILHLQQSIASLPPGSKIWMETIIQNWFGFPSPKLWQVQNTLRLYNGMDVFLTSSTGSGKTILMLASVLTQTIMN